MSEQDGEWFGAAPERQRSDSEVMYVDVNGYEGPLDLLLDMARRQKVDLANISVLALAEQYLAFIDTIRQRRMEVAADYLVMAAWLAYLKSRLMVPQAPTDEEPSGEMMAAMLQHRLKRLEAMRTAAEKLVNQPRLGVRVFARGAPQPIAVTKHNLWEANLYELLKAYAVQRERGVRNDFVPVKRTVWSLQEARDVLQRLIGESLDWVSLDSYLTEYLAEPEAKATVIASSFTASLELVRQGQVEVRQTSAFAPLFLRRRKGEANG